MEDELDEELELLELDEDDVVEDDDDEKRFEVARNVLDELVPLLLPEVDALVLVEVLAEDESEVDDDPPPPPLLVTTVIDPPPLRPPVTTVVAPPSRRPRICGEIKDAERSAVVTPVSLNVRSIGPVEAWAVRMLETPAGPPVLGIRELRWV